MSSKDIEKMKELLAKKKATEGFLKNEKKVGSGWVEKQNKNKGNGPTRTKKIAQ